MRERRRITRKKTDIHKSSFQYRLTKFWSDLSTRMSYFRSETIGLEKIPQDSIVIFAPNHCNTLIDALNILRMRKGPTVYGARADLFNKPALAKILRYLKIVPLVRVRDGLSNVTKNYETMSEVYTVLGDGIPFCMFPEGTHRPMHSLLSLKKGIFRMAIEVDQLYDRDVYVVPVGLEYGDYFRFGSTCLIQIGDAINVSSYMREHPDEGDAETYRNLLGILKERMSELITYIPDDDNYQAIWDYTRIKTAGRRPSSLQERLKNNRTVISSVLKDLDNADAASLLEAKLNAAKEFNNMRKAEGISYRSFGFKHPLLRFVGKTLLALILLPILLPFAIFSAMPMIVSGFLCNKLIKDKAFCNSVRDVVIFLLAPIEAIITLIVGLCCSVAWYDILLLMLSFFVAPAIAYWCLEWSRRWLSDLRLMFKPALRKKFETVRTM